MARLDSNTRTSGRTRPAHEDVHRRAANDRGAAGEAPNRAVRRRTRGDDGPHVMPGGQKQQRWRSTGFTWKSPDSTGQTCIEG